MNQVCNHLLYLSAKFGALNQRIKEIRSSENQWWPLPQIVTLRFVKQLTLWLSDLAAMLPRASGTIMDNSLHVSPPTPPSLPHSYPPSPSRFSYIPSRPAVTAALLPNPAPQPPIRSLYLPAGR